jgi:hypothetical protein
MHECSEILINKMCWKSLQRDWTIQNKTGAEVSTRLKIVTAFFLSAAIIRNYPENELAYP